MMVNWFPGHMHKARLEIASAMRRVQLVVEVLDARAPFSSENPLVPELRGPTPFLKVLNKSDLADPACTQRWVTFLEAQAANVRALPINGLDPDDVRSVLTTGESMLPRGPGKTALVMILGVPNVGKSTIINSLVGRRVCKTANRPAVTQHQQLIELTKKIRLLDTPGFLWPRLVPAQCGMRLAISGAVNEVAFDYDSAAAFLADHLLTSYPDQVSSAYGPLPPELTDAHSPNPLNPDAKAAALVALVAERRGCLQAGGVPDMARAAEALVRDYRKGRIGGITLETPEMALAEGGLESKLEGTKGRLGREERLIEKRRLRRLARSRKVPK